MNQKKAYITFVVPAYNVESTLSQTLDSLLEQSLIAHKIILVNDGSTDNTESICEQYYRDHSDIITYVKQENKGLSGARNTGLNLVDTEYVSFLDSDDIQDRKVVELLDDYLSKLDVKPEIILTLPTIYDMATNRTVDWYDRQIFLDNLTEQRDKSIIKTFNARENPRIYSLEVNACRKIYSVEFLRKQNFTFPEGLKWEDIPSHFALLHNANNIGALETGFFYRISSGSQITTNGGKGRLDIIPIFNQLLDVILKDEWRPQETAYAVRLIVSYTKWFVDVTNIDYIDQLLEGLHHVYRRIPKGMYNNYLNTCSPHRRKEKVLYMILRSSFYGLYRDYRLKDSVKHIIDKIKR